jgi:hypothetical protein
VRTGVIDQDTAHDVRRDREEMSAALPAHAALIDELEIRLVDERRRGKRMVAALTPQVAPGQATQFAVNGVHQRGSDRLLAVAPRRKESRDIRGVGHGTPMMRQLHLVRTCLMSALGDETTFAWFPRFPYPLAPLTPGAGAPGGLP